MVAFFFFLFQGCLADFKLDQVQRDNMNIMRINNELLQRLEIQYRFTEKVMVRVQALERKLGLDKRPKKTYLKNRLLKINS
jgi:hypothetical protein